MATCSTCLYRSEVESRILNAGGEPAYVNVTDVVTVNNETGLLANKEENENFSGPIALADYPIQNSAPLVINKRANCVECSRNVTVRYLAPGQVAEPGPIIINQAQNILAQHAPPGNKYYLLI